MKIITLNPQYNIPELKEKIRQVVREHTGTKEDIHISVIYYEANTYKKPKTKKRRK
jgi:hypothetical protein